MEISHTGASSLSAGLGALQQANQQQKTEGEALATQASEATAATAELEATADTKVTGNEPGKGGSLDYIA